MQHEKQINFKYSNSLVIILAQVKGRNNRNQTVRCAVDTACGMTTIRTDIIDSLGYSFRDAEKITNVISPSGEEQGYLIKIGAFSFDKYLFKDMPVDVFDLPENLGIDCLIGNDILSRYMVTIDYRNEKLGLGEYNNIC